MVKSYVEKNFRKDTGLFTRIKAMLKLILLFDTQSWSLYKTKCDYWKAYYESQALKQQNKLKKTKQEAGIEPTPKFDMMKHYQSLLTDEDAIKDPDLKAAAKIIGPFLLHKYKTELEVMNEDSTNDVEADLIASAHTPLNDDAIEHLGRKEAIDQISKLTTEEMANMDSKELYKLSLAAGQKVSLAKIKYGQKKMKEFIKLPKEEQEKVLEKEQNGKTNLE